MIVPIFDLNGVKVTKIGPGTLCIKAGRSWIYLTYEELVDIAEAVAQHLSAADIPCPDLGEWDPLGQGGGG